MRSNLACYKVIGMMLKESSFDQTFPSNAVQGTFSVSRFYFKEKFPFANFCYDWRKQEKRTFLNFWYVKHPQRLLFSHFNLTSFLLEFHDDVMWHYTVMRNQNLLKHICLDCELSFFLHARPVRLFLGWMHTHSFYSLWKHFEWAFYGS
jgi:hypothetical protein